MKLFLSMMLLFTSMLAPQAAHAQTAWPSAPVTLIVPFAPGGSTDIAARLLAQHLSTRIGQPVLTVNRPGGTGVIGAGLVVAAKPDGLTFLFGSGSLAAGPSLMKSVPYDTATDFVPVSQLTAISSILVVHPSVPAKNVREFTDYVKANPGKVNYGSAGIGSLQHVAGALFEKQIGGKMMHIAYKGGAPANADLVAGRVQAVFGPIVELLPFVKAGSVRVLGVTSNKTSPVFPDAPPISADVPGYEIGTWHGMFAPKGTPSAIVNGMNSAVVASLADPAVRNRLLELGLEPVGSSPAEFSGYFLSEIKRWKELVQISGATPE
jgi:tripartite-type tricarboxylate transporter receptor subunit TctC